MPDITDSLPAPLKGYLARLLDPTDSTASLKHAAYAVVIAAGVVWLSVDMAIKEVGGGHRGVDANWVTAFGLLLSAVTLAKMKSQEPQP